MTSYKIRVHNFPGINVWIKALDEQTALIEAKLKIISICKKDKIEIPSEWNLEIVDTMPPVAQR